MRLKTILPQLDKLLLNRYADINITGVSCNSRDVSSGDIFVAIKGTKLDANQFVAQAIKRGARVIVSDSRNRLPDLGKAVFIKVKDARLALGEIAANFYGNPSDKVKVVGITGTNGKTTISYLLEHILNTAGLQTGVIGTINYRLKNKRIAATNTTPGPIEIQSLLSQMRKARIKYCLMEVSSHALDQNRVAGVIFDSAIFANLTGDHLDYHLNLENYFSAKSRLFKGLKNNACAIINLDDKYAARLLKITKGRALTYGIYNKNCRVRAEGLKLSIDGAEFIIRSKKGIIPMKTGLLGKHNVYNILAAVSWALARNIGVKFIKKAIETFKSVPGRLEEVKSNLDFKVFVDFAHTADALRNVLTSLKELQPSRLIVVFGCGGERDRTKRPLMGKIATELADFSIITTDNPRSEEPSAIAGEIIKGISSLNYQVILDRAQAIKKAVSLAKREDIVLIAGKGHESYQILKNQTIPFDDKAQVKEALGCLR